MAQWLTQDALVVCTHKGRVDIHAEQGLVTVKGRRVLVRPDTEHKDILKCPYLLPGQTPCRHTGPVEVGVSTFVRIQGKPVCLDTLRGGTDGSPGHFQYLVPVDSAGQRLVAEVES